MRMLAALFGLFVIGLGVFFQTMPETQGCGNGFIIACGIMALVYSVGVVPGDKPAPAPEQKRAEWKEETPTEIARREERDWTENQNSRAHIRCAAQFRAYVERGRTDQAREFTDAMSPKFHRAVLIGAKIITESERT